MKFVACVSTLALALMLSNNSTKNVNSDITDDVFNNQIQNIEVKKSSNYTIGDFDLKIDDTDTAYFSPLRIRLNSNVRYPRASITISYTDVNNNVAYVFNRKNISREYNSRNREFYLKVYILLDNLAAESVVNFSFNYETKRDVTSLAFKLTNPKFPIVGDGEAKRIYLRFNKSFSSTHGLNYYSNIMMVNKNDYDNHEFYYDHLDIDRNFAIRSPFLYSISNMKLVFNNKNQNLFNNISYVINQGSAKYRAINLLSIQRKTDYYTDLEIDGELFYDPTTNEMFSEVKEGTINSKNRIYFPKETYANFKTFEFYFVFDYEVSLIKMKVALKNVITFDENFIKDLVVVNKTTEKVVEDYIGAK